MGQNRDDRQARSVKTVAETGPTRHACGGSYRADTDSNGRVHLECLRCHERESVLEVRAPRLPGVTYREQKGYSRNLPNRLSEFYDHEP